MQKQSARGSEHGVYEKILLPRRKLTGLQRFMHGEERLCLVRNELGIFPLLLSSLSPAGATLEFKRTVDGVHFQPGQRVTLIGVDNRFEHLLREVVGSVVWFDMSYVGVFFEAELAVGLDELRRDLCS